MNEERAHTHTYTHRYIYIYNIIKLPYNFKLILYKHMLIEDIKIDTGNDPFVDSIIR